MNCPRLPAPHALLALSALCLLPQATAFGSDDDNDRQRFERLLADHLRPLTVNSGQIAGDGANWLLDEGGKADLFVIGEQHATADIAEFSHALLRGLMERGYRKMALEVGPWSTRFAEDLMRRNDGAFEAFMAAEDTALALPFLFFREESELVFTALRADPDPPTLWGLDQEFIAAAPILLPRLSERAVTDAEQQALATVGEAAAGNVMFLGATDASTLAALREAFAPRADAEALRLIDDMIVSNRIYQPFTGRGGTVYAANLERENYMKARFLEAYRHWSRDGAKPRVFLKFGATHGSRGRSSTNVPALTDFLVEWGRSEGLTLFNLHIDCDGGVARDIRSGDEVPCQSYFSPGADDPLHAAARSSGPAVIDLRPFRPWAARMDFLDRATVDLVYAYDAYLVLPQVRAASTFRSPKAPDP